MAAGATQGLVKSRVAAPAVAAKDRWTRTEVAWVAALAVGVVLAGSWRLGSTSLWSDETATWAISGHSFGDVVSTLTNSGGDRGAALYYVVIFGWMKVFGTSEAAARSLSLLAAAVTLIPFHAIARRVLDRPGAYTATALLATSSFLLHYARELRTYAFAVLLVVVTAWAFLRAVSNPRRRSWILFTVAAVLAVYAHWFSALVVLALFAALALAAPSREIIRPALLAGAAIAVATAPIALLIATGQGSGVGWVAPLNRGEFDSLARYFTGANRTFVQLGVLGVAAIGWVAIWTARRRQSPAGRPVPLIALTWFPLPVALTIAISVVKPLLIARYLIVALPGFALLLAAGVTVLARGRRTLAIAGVAALVVVAASSYRGVWSYGGKENWRAVVETVAARAAPGDAIIVYPGMAATAFNYYARDMPPLAARSGTSWPPRSWDTPFYRFFSNPSVLTSDAVRHARVVWLVMRVPGGVSLRQGTADSRVVATLRQTLARRLGPPHEVPPWRTTQTVSILKFDEANAPPTLTPGQASIVEGNRGTKTLQIPVSLSAASKRTVTASWTTRNDGAVAPSDYLAASGTVTFAPGQTSQLVSITINGDTLREPDERFFVSFKHPTNANLGGIWGLGFGFITNDD
jgi:4-amino-4-deoxy-L-arabinose transferase-like glycosyltransferase